MPKKYDLSAVTDAQLRCLINHFHALVPFNPNGNPTWVPANGWRDSQRCENCQTERHDVYNRTGRREYRRYVDPPWKVKLRRVPHEEFVLEMARRQGHAWSRKKIDTRRPTLVPIGSAKQKAYAS